MDNIENDYMIGIADHTISIVDKIARSALENGPRFDDNTLANMIIEAISGIVGINGGDFDGVYSNEISMLLGVAAQLNVRRMVLTASIMSMQDGVAN